MKTRFLVIWIFLIWSKLSAQEKITLGFGYYGENIFNPGLVMQVEKVLPISAKLSFPIRLDIGAYFHKRNHFAVFTSISGGVRYHFAKRFYMGLGIGFGSMGTWHHSDDGVFSVDDQGGISKVSNFAGIDFMPSTHLELGFRTNSKSENPSSIWLRPKYFVQMNVNERPLLHLAIEIGYSFTLNAKK